MDGEHVNEQHTDRPKHITDVPHRRNKALLRALYHDVPILWNGVEHALRSALFSQNGWDINAMASLAGREGLIDESEIDVAPAAASTAQTAPQGYEEARVLLHALHTAYPMTLNDRDCFVHSLRFDRSAARVVETVHIARRAEPVPVAMLTRRARPDPFSFEDNKFASSRAQAVSAAVAFEPAPLAFIVDELAESALQA